MSELVGPDSFWNRFQSTWKEIETLTISPSWPQTRKITAEWMNLTAELSQDKFGDHRQFSSQPEKTIENMDKLKRGIINRAYGPWFRPEAKQALLKQTEIATVATAEYYQRTYAGAMRDAAEAVNFFQQNADRADQASSRRSALRFATKLAVAAECLWRLPNDKIDPKIKAEFPNYCKQCAKMIASLPETVIDGSLPTMSAVIPNQENRVSISPENLVIAEACKGISSLGAMAFDAFALRRLPESIISPSSAIMGTKEKKGGAKGEGVVKQFRGIFGLPVDANHLMIKGSAPASLEKGLYEVSRRRAAVELWLISLLNDTERLKLSGRLATALVTDGTSLSHTLLASVRNLSFSDLHNDAMHLAASNKELLKKTLGAVVDFDAACARRGKNELAGFGAIQAIINSVAEPANRPDGILRLIGLANEAMKDNQVMKKLGLDIFLQ